MHMRALQRRTAAEEAPTPGAHAAPAWHGSCFSEAVGTPAATSPAMRVAPPPASRFCRVALVGAALAWVVASSAAWAQDTKPRLKFKGKGSACLCDDATGEEAIARADRTRAAASSGPASAPARTDRAAVPRAAAPASSPPPKPPEEQRP